MNENTPKFETWAMVELFGHQQVSGKLSEQTIGSAQFLRMDIPETPHTPPFTKFYNPSAIYGITPVDEEYAVKMAEKLNVQPVANYNHTQIIRELVQKQAERLNPPKEEVFDDQSIDDAAYENGFDDDLNF